MNCLSCAHLNFRKVTRAQAAAEHGYCDSLERYPLFVRADTDCARFEPAPEDGVVKRVAWLQQIKFK